jgi:flavin-dependent dehydrogenase
MGIEQAIESARLGASALLEVMEGGNASARFAEYEDKIRGTADRHGRTAAYHYGRL